MIQTRTERLAPSRADLHRLLRRWTRLVDRCATRPSSGARRISAAEYVCLRNELQAACGRCLAAAEQPETRLLERLATLVEPWVSLEALTHGDPRILRELRDRCVELERQLFPARAGLRWGRRAASAAAAVALAGAGWAAAQSAGESARDLVHWPARALALPAQLAARIDTSPSQLGLLTAVAVLVGMWLANSARRF